MPKSKKLIQGGADEVPAPPVPPKPPDPPPGCMTALPLFDPEIHTIQIAAIRPIPGFVVPGELAGSDIYFLLDSGAEISLIRDDVARELQLRWVPYTPRVGAANGQPVKVIGQVETDLCLGGFVYIHSFAIIEVVNVNFDAILGQDFTVRHGLDLCASSHTLEFPWGGIPLLFNTPKKLQHHRPEGILKSPALCTPPRNRRVTFNDSPSARPVRFPRAPQNRTVDWGLLPFSNGVFADPPSGGYSIIDSNSRGKSPVVSPYTLALVHVRVNVPVGSELFIQGIDVGGGDAPVPTLATVDSEGYVSVLCSNTSPHPVRFTGRYRRDITFKVVDPQLEIRLVDALNAGLGPEIKSEELHKCLECGDVEIADEEYVLCKSCLDQNPGHPGRDPELWPEIDLEQDELSDEEFLALFNLSKVPPQYLQQIQEILLEFKGAFAYGKGKLSIAKMEGFRIDTGNAPPVRKRPYPIPYHLRRIVEATIREMLELGVIIHSESEYSAPLLLVRKKSLDGMVKWRPCVDFRALNISTKPLIFPYPTTQEILDSFHGSQFFVVFDMTNSYWQCPMHPDDQHKTAFVCHAGQFEFTRLAFGLKNGPPGFSKRIQQAYGDMKDEGVAIFIDDFCVSGGTFPILCKRLRKVLGRAVELNIKFGPEKSQILQQQFEFLGFEVSAAGVLPSQSKVAAIAQLTPPRTMKGVKGFVQMCNYYRKFVPSFAEIALPLTDMTRGRKPLFRWGPDQQKAFDELKAALSSATRLAFPDPARPFHLTTDASTRAIAGVLEQEEEDGQRRPVAFFSAKLVGAQTRYPSILLELLGVVLSVEHFHMYLLGVLFYLHVDSSGVRWVTNTPDLKPMWARWVMRLMPYRFVIDHIPGKTNQRADFFSRPEEPRVNLFQLLYDEGTVENQFGVNLLDVLTQRSLDMKGLKEEQKTDAMWKWIYAQAAGPEKKEGYHLDARGVLYKWGNNNALLCVPEKYREKVLQLHHNTVWGGHWGATKMTKALKQRYYWPNMDHHIAEHLAKCEPCLMRKQAPTLKPPQQMSSAPAEVGTVWYVDVVGPLKCTRRKNVYILTMMEAFSRFVEAVAIPDQQTQTVCRAFVRSVICRYGACRTLISDNGSNFTSRLFEAVCATLKIRHVLTSPYNPKANPIESMHKGLGDFLSIFLNGDTEEEWDELLDFALLSLRANHHTSTGFSPAHLLYGNPMKLPWDEEIKPLELEQKLSLEARDYLTLLRFDLELAREEAHRSDLWTRHRTWEASPDCPELDVNPGD